MPRDPNKVSAGLVAPEESAEPELYVTGSKAADEIEASYDSESQAVSLTLGSGSAFDRSPIARKRLRSARTRSGRMRTPLHPTRSSSPVSTEMTLSPWPTSRRHLDRRSAATAKTSRRGAGRRRSRRRRRRRLGQCPGGDDAVLNNEGADALDGGTGEDLLISNSVCDGDRLDGGPANRDNASWANFEPVMARPGRRDGGAGRSGDQPECGSGPLSTRSGSRTSRGQLRRHPGRRCGPQPVAGQGWTRLLLRPRRRRLDPRQLRRYRHHIDCGAGPGHRPDRHPTRRKPTTTEPRAGWLRGRRRARQNSFRPPGTPPIRSRAGVAPAAQPAPPPDGLPPLTCSSTVLQGESTH